MQCTRYIPEYYYPRDHNAASSGNSRSISHNDITWNSSRGFNISLPQFVVNQNQDLVHQKEILRQMILRHEAAFRYQVKELHRVYGRQRELMDEIKRRKLVDHLHFQAEPNTFMSQLRSEISGKSYWPIVNLTSIEPFAPSKEMFQESSNSTGKTVQQGGDYFSGRNVSKECNLSSSKSNISRKRMLDLEVPPEEYIDNEEGEPFEKENSVIRPNIMIPELQPQCYSKVNVGDSSISLSSCRGTSLLFDLNEPVQPVESEWQNSALESQNIHDEIRDNTCEHIAAVKDNKVSNYTSSQKGMDLNLTPPNHLSEYQSASTSNISHLNFPEGRNVEIHKISEVLDSSSIVPDSTPESRKCTSDNHLKAARIDSNPSTTDICIDFYSCTKEEFLSSRSSEATTPTAERDMEVEGPVSPENKECSPPRGDSQDIISSTSIHLSKGGHSDLVEELDKVAADILIFISSSAVGGYSKTAISEPSEASNNCLGLLAEVAAALARFPENEVEQHMEVHFECDVPLSDRNDCSRTMKLNLRDSVPAVDSLLHQANEKNISPKASTWRKTPSKTSSRARRRSNDGKRTMCSLLQHTPENKHGIADRFLKGWGLTKKRQRARRAQSYMWSSFSFLADE
ncbi:PREDICTED: uncharacterized protein LOC109210850 [Nicotiana attenuata]|uniref:Uncharacterized protein n=1 Tax=Nicotiana attenuata TaxID=49451 RepID=A0A314KKQ5_NICAT|nr:PREDICTED: uncharacterized protein LOC109210850 [Nicotiana attenuata]OIT29818.1 hypothetical protein A4A49_26881 [Nicotiana attenuata]